jgi:lysophospholipase L1-like esterase
LRRRVRAVVSGVAGVVAATGAFLFGFGGTNVARPARLDTPAGTYFALGDSYSAGEGLNPYIRGTQNVRAGGNRCHRSNEAFGAILGSRATMFRACSGAVIAEISSVGQQHDGFDVGGPQLQGVTHAALVTMTISGNDALFADVVQFCALRLHCIDSTKWNRDGELTLRSWVDARLARISTDLSGLLSQISERLPGARVVVVGYPRLFSVAPNSGGQRSCLIYKVFSDDERSQLRDLGDRLNFEIARQALATGHEYVHVADAFDRHETCGSGGQWLQFFRIDLENLTTKDAFDAGNFHPTTDGQAMMARLVACYLKAHPDPDVAANVRTNANAAQNLATLFDGRSVGRSGDAVFACAMH